MFGSYLIPPLYFLADNHLTSKNRRVATLSHSKLRAAEQERNVLKHLLLHAAIPYFSERVY